MLKELTVIEQKEAVEVEDVGSLLKTCGSLKEVSEKVSEFSLKDGRLICVVCGGIFECPESSLEPSEKAKKFSSLKFNLKGHLKTAKHISKLAENDENSVYEERLKSREQAIAEKIGAICYFTIHTGRPNSDFPILVYLSNSFGTDLGDINHSKNFPGKFCPILAEINLTFINFQVIRKRTNAHLSTRLAATGCLPPVNIIMDKFTYHHWTRQLVGLITLSPGSKQLIQPMFLEAPMCPKGDGEYLKSNIVSVTDK